MTSPADRHRLPGATLLRIAPLLFSEQFVSTVVHPTIADLQSEFAAAGASRIGRLRALVRGYAAFWTVVIVAPFAQWAAPKRTDDASSGFAVRYFTAGVAALTVFAFAGALFEVSAGLVIVAGALCAVAIHAWYGRHPSETPILSRQPWRTPQINFSSMDVAGNVGGLIFVVGSLLIVVLAVPQMLGILIAGAAAGCLLAWRLIAWHRSHPNWGLPENRIVLR
jgi:hypothetical protein